MYPTFFHLAAYSASLVFGSTLTPVAAVADQVLTRTTANNYILPKPGKLLAWAAFGANITDAQINTPSLRYVGLPFAGVVNNSATIPSPVGVNWYDDYGPTLPTVDEIQILHSLAGAANEQEFSLLWLQFDKRPAIGGPVYRLKFTATITGVVGAWASGTIAPTSTLPQGTYDVVGGDCFGTNMIAWRLIFPGSFFRPGTLARNTQFQVPWTPYPIGQFGKWGTFKSVNLPNLEIIVNGANTAQTLFLDLVRTGDWTP